MRSRTLTAEDRAHYYERYRALHVDGLRLNIIAKRLGLPYHTLRDIVDKAKGKGRFSAKKEEAVAKKPEPGGGGMTPASHCPPIEGAEQITFRVYGCPVAQGRPRAFKMGDHIRMYDPKNSKGWKETVKWQAIETMKAAGNGMLDGPLSMTLQFLMPRPKSLPKKVIHHTKKPDVDNLVKAVKDALKSVCYHDDSQIVSLTATKGYGEPGVMVVIIPAGVPGAGQPRLGVTNGLREGRRTGSRLPESSDAWAISTSIHALPLIARGIWRGVIIRSLRTASSGSGSDGAG